MSVIKLKSEEPTVIGMNSWSLMQVDDLMKFTILDPYVGFNTRKIHPYNSFTSTDKSAAEAIISKGLLIDKKKYNEVQESLKDLFRKQNLYFNFNIQYSTWVNQPLRSYLTSISIDSPILIKTCHRYTNEESSLGIVAKYNIAKNTKLRCLMGICKPMDPEREKLLAERNLNFSVIESTRTSKPVLMLGTAALVNHDCDPNCFYFSTSKTCLIIMTNKEIKKGEELYCYYGKNYFGELNRSCECLTCEKNKTGFFSKIENDNTNKSAAYNHTNTQFPIESLLNLDIQNSRNKENCFDQPTTERIPSNYSDGHSVSHGEAHSEDLQFTCKNPILNLDENCVSIENSGSLDDCFGFLEYIKLDRKLDKAVVKLEKINPIIAASDTTRAKNRSAFCIFCEKFEIKFPRHLRKFHSDKNIVKQYVNHKDIKLRQSSIAFLRNQGYAHYEQITGIVIPVMNQRKDAVHQVIKTQCNNCCAYFSKSTLWSHKKYCYKFTVAKMRNKHQV